jgi:hypothetical protein
VAPSADRGHWSRIRHAEPVAALQSPQEETCLDASGRPERRGSDFAPQPHKWLVPRAHDAQLLSDTAYSQHNRGPASASEPSPECKYRNPPVRLGRAAAVPRHAT